MTAALTLLLTVGLLQGALCQEHQTFMPSTLKVLKGSCVTIPCSFQIPNNENPDLDGTCIAIWYYRKNGAFTEVFRSSDPQNSEIKGNFTGNLLKKDCTTTLYNLQSQNSRGYRFRLNCDVLRWNFDHQTSEISVEDNPHRPTLTPPTLKVKEGTSVSLECSAPATCLFLPPNLTWTPGLGEAQETLQENQDKTKVKISVLNFTASHLHDGQEISCTAVYGKQDGSTESSVNTSLTAEITYSPKDTTVSVSPSGPVQEDSNVTLTCSSRANPAVKNYTWYRADEGQETLVGTGPVLHFKASKDSGPFVCQAENEEGAGCSNSTQIDVQYSPKDTTVSVSPTGPVQEGSILTLACSSSANPAVKNYTWYRAHGGQESFIGTGRVLNMKASRDSPSFFCKAENEMGSGQSNISQIEVQFAPQILSSSDCTRTVNQVNCSCEAIGNPAPSLQWTLDGLPINHSDKSTIKNGHLNGICVSFITMSQTQWKDQFTLLCGSSNSLGSDSQRFLFYSLEAETAVESQGHVILPVFIATIVGLLVLVCALLVLVCILLRVIRAQKIPHNLLQASDNTSTVAEDQLPPSGEGNEEPIKAEEAIYANSNMLKKPHVTKPSNTSATNSTNLPSSAKNGKEDAGKSSEEKNEKSKDLVYTTVTWRGKGQKEIKDPGDTNLSGSSKQQEVKCTEGGICRDSVSNAVEMGNIYDNVEPGSIRKETQCEYAQVKFKDKGDLQK
ncbi:B-cell receptor CD22-like isoform X2 [Cheilinus undulatus]|uniref:B-cell receptor CD22-like isoform X2 n=1 Tax=Cheilinus undulatus TaxID=241271 RepID=UPI001BD3247F|nr:B-cell receptor CD22-like isoform X2 [Cheilinus undulatus]